MKVIKEFFCIQEKVSYKVGDEYKGKRTDLGHVLEAPKKKEAKKKATPKTENKNGKPELEDK